MLGIRKDRQGLRSSGWMEGLLKILGSADSPFGLQSIL